MALDLEHVQILLDIKADLAETKAMVNSLSGPEGRITKIENSQTRHAWLSGINLAVSPILVIAHSFARKLGVNI